MSTRSTPARPFPPSLSTPSTPPAAAARFRPGHTRTRHGSTLSISGISGMSTPGSTGSASTSIRRKERYREDAAAEQDWAGVDPDEAFRRLPVAEVKRVEGKMRTDALNKQSELRSMVGTRYRDLLTSASQITALHSSSLRLSEGLRTVGAACANPAELADAGSDRFEESEYVGKQLPVAAHMKLLLDAPEVLYSYLAHHAYLPAAFLWLVARVVKEGMSGMPEEAKGPYAPLLQKQWEALLPFRAQIVQRATSALQSRDKFDPKLLSDTLLAIVLLDNLPVSDALDLVLSQRLKTVREILTPRGSNKDGRRRRSSSHIDAKDKPRGKDEIARAIAEAVRSLLDAVAVVREVFDKRRGGGDESMLSEAIRLVQAGEAAPAPPPASTRNLAHQRRASRLHSISLPLPTRATSTPTGPPVSAPLVIQDLPSSQILLRYLPTQVTAFTPFVAPSAAPPLADKLAAWQDAAVGILREAVPAWLAGLQSVADVWRVRRVVSDVLGDAQFEAQIATALEAEWGARVQAIWTAKLDALVVNAGETLRTASRSIRAGRDKVDNDPEAFMFSDIAFPSVAGVTGTSTAFNSLLGTLRKRTAFRTPLLDSVLSSLESAAASIKDDLADLPEPLLDDYRAKIVTALDALVKAFSDVLADAGGHRDATGSVEAEMFVGRVALYLIHTSSFLPDLNLPGVDLEPIKTAFMDIHTSSTIQWQGLTVKGATDLLSPLFDAQYAQLARTSTSTSAPTAPTAPSAAIMYALTHLVQAVRALGIPTGMSLPTVPGVVSAFVKAARALPGWKAMAGERAAQAALDLSLLAVLDGGSAKDDEAVRALFAKVPDMDDFKASLPDTLLESLRRTQLTLAPLVQHLAAAAPAPVPRRGVDRSAALLRLGAPALAARAVGVSADVQSVIPLARAGPRYGLLSIVV